MNANEVITNLALERMERPRGDYATIHLNDHVNRSHSTNANSSDGFRLAVHARVEASRRAIEAFTVAFADKGDEFANTLMMGRAQLQNAVLMTLGREMAAGQLQLNVMEPVIALSLSESIDLLIHA